MLHQMKAEFNQTVMTQQVYEKLRKVICSGGWFTPGERVNIDQICAEWQISKTPVREALKALEQDGVINYIPRRGFFVKVPSLEELKNIMEIRTALEVYALERGFRTIDRKEMSRLSKEFRETFAAMRKDGNAEPYLAVDHKFHSYIIGTTRNRKMMDTYENIGGEMHYLRYRDTFETECAMGNSMPEHMEIIQAILNDDQDGAIRALKMHLSNVEARLVELNHAEEHQSASISVGDKEIL